MYVEENEPHKRLKQQQLSVREWLFQRINTKPKVVKIKKPPIQKKQNLIYRVRKRIIEMRYGQVGHCDRTFMTYSEMSRRIGILRCTIIKVCEVYRKNGCTLKYNPKLNTREYKTKLTENYMKYFASYECLDKLKNKTLKERANQISIDTGVSVSCRTVLRIYKRNGIRYEKPAYKYWRKKTPDEELTEQVEFCNDLAQLMLDGKDIIYFDETTSNIWDKRLKVFQHPNRPLM